MIAVDSPFKLINLLPLLALENVEYKTIRSHNRSETIDGPSKTCGFITVCDAEVVTFDGSILPWPEIIFNKLGLHALLLLFDIADHVKYITYSDTNEDCKMPLVGLYSWTFGSKLIIVATTHNNKLNVMKKICNPHPDALKIK